MGKKRKAGEANGDVISLDVPRKKVQPAADAVTEPATNTKASKSGLFFSPRPDWHAAELPAIAVNGDAKAPSPSTLATLKEHAVSLLEAENAKYAATNLAKSSSQKFISTIMTSGTLEDRISALTLVVQESPLHTMKHFENLIALSKKKSRNQALLALGALKDLLGQGVVLPPERKLRAFERQPELLSAMSDQKSWTAGSKLPGTLKEAHLILFAYEDWLKKTYFEILKVLELWCNDEVEYARNRAITFVWELLKEKPEQEENLLRLLVNKLGDSEKKVASRASYLILQLETSHPMMKPIVAGAIESELLLRPGQTLHAQYYAIITLNQTVLSTREQEMANKLLEIYFALFVRLLKLKDPKLEAGIQINSKGNVQGGGGKMGRKARQKAKLKEAAVASEIETKERMIAQVLTGVNRAFPYAKTDDATFESHIDTIYKVTHSSNFNTSVQALMLLQQIAASRQYGTDRFYRALYESLVDPRLATSSKQILYLNLLYRALKADTSIKRVKAFVKRLLQVITVHEPPFICGVLYLVHELQTSIPSLKSMLTDPEIDDEDEEEHFVDAPEDDDEPTTATTNGVNGVTKTTSKNAYDGRKRDPQFSNADKTCLWELLAFQTHYHPTVALFSQKLLSSQPMPEKPDPTLHTLMHFLDRFVYRNAKQKQATRGVSIMQPMAGAPNADLLIQDRGRAGKELPFNDEAFLAKKAEDIAADEVFFHQYFAQSGRKKTRQEKRAEKEAKKPSGLAVADDDDDDDVEGGVSDEDEEEIWNALVGSRPEIEGPSDEESDVDIAEFMSDDEDMDGEDDADGGVEFREFASDEEEGEDLVVVDGPDAAADSDDGMGDIQLDSEEEGAMVGSDDELPAELDIPFAQFDKEESNKEKRKRKKTLKQLPTFASIDDYAKLLGDDDDEGNM